MRPTRTRSAKCCASGQSAGRRETYVRGCDGQCNGCLIPFDMVWRQARFSSVSLVCPSEPRTASCAAADGGQPLRRPPRQSGKDTSGCTRNADEWVRPPERRRRKQCKIEQSVRLCARCSTSRAFARAHGDGPARCGSARIRKCARRCPV